MQTYPDFPVGVRVGSTSLSKDSRDHMIEVVIRVRVIKPFRKPINENPRVRVLHRHLWVGPVVVRHGEEEIPQAPIGIAAVQISTLHLRASLGIIAGEVIPDHRMHFDFAQESPSRDQAPEQQHRNRDADSRVDAVLDVGENRDKHPDEEDEHFPRRDPPKLINRVGRRDEVAHRMNDDRRETGLGNVEEHRRERVDGEEHHDRRDHAGERGSDARLGLDGGARKRPRRRVRSEKGTQQIRDADGDHLLRGIDGVIVDATKRFRNRNVLDQQHDHRGRQVADEGFDDGLVDRGSGRVLEPCRKSVSRAGIREARTARLRIDVPRGTLPTRENRHCFLSR